MRERERERGREGGREGGSEGGRRENHIHFVCALSDAGNQGPNEDVTLLKSSTERRLILNYDDLQTRQGNTTLSWLYSEPPSTTCPVSSYRVDAYSGSEVFSGDLNEAPLTAHRSFLATAKNVTFNSQLLANGSSANFFLLTAVGESGRDCVTSPYYYNLSFDGMCSV